MLKPQIAYSYYPKDLDYTSNRDKYVQSGEFLNLKKTISKHSNFKTHQDFLDLFKELENEYEIVDNTCFEWFDRCYNWQFILASDETNNKVINDILCVNLSIVSDIFCIYILRTEFLKKFKRLSKLPFRNEECEILNADKIEAVKKIVDSHLNINYVKMDFLNTILPDISFQEIGFGKFNLFNAFFLNEFHTKLW